MSRIQLYQNSFTSGELDPLLRGRLDIDQRFSGVSQAKNVIFEPQGGFSRRPGLKYVADVTADNASNGAMLIPFEYATTQSFMILASAYNTTSTIRFRFFADGALLTNINSSGNAYLDYSVGTLYSVSNFDIKKLYFTQSHDTLICCHENFAPFKVVRGANNTTWTISALSMTIPKTGFSVSDQLGTSTDRTTNVSGATSNTVTPSATTGNVTLASANNQFMASDVGQYFMQDNGYGRARIVKFVTVQNVKAVVEIPFFDTNPITVKTSTSTEGYYFELGYEAAWSNSRGWPRTCTFHEGRLYFGGSAAEPNTIWASRVGDFFHFDPTHQYDDDAFKITLSTDSTNAITAIRSGKDLQIFTTGGEFYLPQYENDPITPSNVVVKSATRRGSKANIRPTGTDTGTMFIQRQGKALREMMFSDVEFNYVTTNISVLSSHLIVDPQSMALRPATDTTEGDLLLIVNGTSTTGYRAASTGLAGTIAAFSLSKSQKIVAPSYLVTTGTFKDVAVDLDTIYCLVARTVSSSTKYYVEIFDDDRTTDSAIQYKANPVSPDQAVPSNTTCGSLGHLEGLSVSIVRDDIVESNKTVSSSAITIDAVPSTYVEVGLNFDVQVVTQPFEPRLSSGSVQSQKRRVVEVTPILYRSQNLAINGTELNLQTLPVSGAGTVPPFTGPKKVQGLLGFDRDAQITITQTQPVFTTVLSLDYKVSVGN